MACLSATFFNIPVKDASSVESSHRTGIFFFFALSVSFLHYDKKRNKRKEEKRSKRNRKEAKSRSEGNERALSSVLEPSHVSVQG